MMISSTVTVASRYLTALTPRAAVSSFSTTAGLLSSSTPSPSSSLPQYRHRHHATIVTNNKSIAITSPTTALASNSTRRTFSDMMPRRAFPQYTSFGPEYAMGVRAVLPQFKRTGGDGVSVERRGKLILDFIPRNNSGAGFAWSQKIYFSLTIEEVGLLLSQLPGNAVELSHPVFGPESNGGGEGGEDPSNSGVRQLSGDVIEKVLTIVPGEGGTVAFTIDYAKDGVPGQTPPGTEGILPVSLFLGREPLLAIVLLARR